jgi:CHAD domain-containing protein
VQSRLAVTPDALHLLVDESFAQPFRDQASAGKSTTGQQRGDDIIVVNHPNLLETAMSRILLFVVLATAALSTQLMAETIREDEHPRLERSIHELEETIKFLEAAPHDFGGHRDEALHDCREALRQLREALAFARNHDH